MTIIMMMIIVVMMMMDDDDVGGDDDVGDDDVTLWLEMMMLQWLIRAELPLPRCSTIASDPTLPSFPT